MSAIAGRAGTNSVDLGFLTSVEVPKKTSTYSPVPHGVLIQAVEETAEKVLNLPIVNRSFVANKAGTQMFFSMALDTGENEKNLLLGGANSYDKSISLRLVAGSSIMVCSNMCISGSASQIGRKHTTGLTMKRLHEEIKRTVKSAEAEYLEVHEHLEHWKSIEITGDRGAELLGRMAFESRDDMLVAMGQEAPTRTSNKLSPAMLSPRQGSIAMGDWRGTCSGNPRHEEFGDKTVYSLYQAVTEGLKNGPPSDVDTRYRAAHGFFAREYSLAA